MDKHSDESRLMPFSSDEGPNSADDSDEDVITDYLAHTDNKMSQRRTSPLVPTISVTPHSPGTRHYPILEDNLHHLHEIHESIQQMRELSAQVLNSQIAGLNQYSRLSTSCPSLNNENGSDPDLGSMNSSPTQTLIHGAFHNAGFMDILHGKANPHEWLMCRAGLDDESPRRRSWTAIEDLSQGKEKHKSKRQRSMSLSSLDSEPDDSFMDHVDSAGSTALLLSEGNTLACPIGNRRAPRTGGTSSTHSLNEADLQSDFSKIIAKREAENLRLLPARLPLQKSISTPSIIAVRDIGNESNTEINTTAIPPLRPSGTESETEEEGLHGKHFHPPLDEFLNLKVFDPQAEKNRRKRGSLFFRKKKDKTKKMAHHWVPYFGPVHSCDWCSKPTQNSALYCEICFSVVHVSCKDHLMDCNKTKAAKNSSKSFTVPSKFSTSKRNSSGAPVHNNNLSNNSQTINEEKEAYGSHHEGINYPDDVPIVQLEFLDEGQITADDLDTDPFLGLHEEEPDSWTPTVGKEVTKKLKEKEIKRQEHIYEFILTEKHHCLTLRVMQKVFVDGLQKHFHLGKDLERMFPRLADLTEIHLNFLFKLRQRQKVASIVTTICDVLIEQFSGANAHKLKSAYGEFCSRHRDAVNMYKNYLHDRRFSEFVRHCQSNPLLKKKGIPECILFVTQRLTKYPLLIEPLIKTAKDNKEEHDRLKRALALVKEILVEVDAQVAEKEKEDRKLEIYNRIDAKSFTTHRDTKFKKADILLKNRKLRFEGVAMLMQGRSKMQVVLVIVLSDVLFFLLENNNKYSFFTPDNKAGVVSLQKLLVREKAGQDNRGIYLISSNPVEPEMFELKIHKPKDKEIWISNIRAAVQSCQEDDEDVILSVEERQKLLDAKHMQIKQIVGAMRQKDVEQAQILEEKMILQQKLLAAAGVESALNPPNYCNLVTEETDSSAIWQEVLYAVHDVNQLANSLYATGTNLSRSVSSVGEHQSEAYISPTLPKRAETFGGFDNASKDSTPLTKCIVKKHHQDKTRDSCNSSCSALDTEKQEDSQLSKDHVPWRNAVITTIPPVVLPSNLCSTVSEVPTPALAVLGQEQQAAAVQLSHHFYKLLSIIHQQMTTIQSLQAQLAAYRLQLSQDDGREKKPMYKHNQQLEELRNLQDRLTQEREAWQRERESEEKEIEEKRQELMRLHEQVRSEQNDVVQQREQLYRKMEMLTSQGILISPNMPVVANALPSEGIQMCSSQKSPDDHGSNISAGENSSPPFSESRRKGETKWKGTSTKSSLPLNLISATNQQKVAQGVKIKQQLPFKLATKLGESSGSTLSMNSGSNSGNSTNTPHSSVAPLGGVQQILPFKLSQSTENRRSGGSSGGYMRLGSGSFSPPSSTPQSEEHVGSNHVRTGSSPAMMQNTVTSGADSIGRISVQRNKADRTNTYPKLPDRFRLQNTDVGHSPGTAPQASEEEVIFF